MNNQRTIQDVKIGDKVENKNNGKGIVSGKTQRTVTVTFENGNVVKITYLHKNDYFYQSDFQ